MGKDIMLDETRQMQSCPMMTQYALGNVSPVKDSQATESLANALPWPRLPQSSELLST